MIVYVHLTFCGLSFRGWVMPRQGMPRTRQRSPPCCHATGRTGKWPCYRERRQKDPQLVFVTSDCRHQGSVTGRAKGEQYYFWFGQAAFPLQVRQATAGLTRHEVLPSARSDLPLPWCRLFMRGRSAFLIVKEAFVVSHASRDLGAKLIGEMYFDLV